VTAFSSCVVPDKTPLPLDPPDSADFSVACIVFRSGVTCSYKYIMLCRYKPFLPCQHKCLMLSQHKCIAQVSVMYVITMTYKESVRRDTNEGSYLTLADTTLHRRLNRDDFLISKPCPEF
jgi:hypothetical protein